MELNAARGTLYVRRAIRFLLHLPTKRDLAQRKTRKTIIPENLVEALFRSCNAPDLTALPTSCWKQRSGFRDIGRREIVNITIYIKTRS